MSRYNYAIKTLAPLHIGTGETLSALEYYIGDEFIVPDLERIFTLHPQAAATFSQNLALRSAYELSHLRLGELLDPLVLQDEGNWRYSIPDLVDSEIGFYTLNKLAEEIKRENGEVRLATKTPDYRAYIPGSSIKGALKTAWAYAQLLNDEGAIDAIARAQVLGNDAMGRARVAEQVIQSRVFQGAGGPRDAAFDLFRVLQISDSAPLAIQDTMLLAGERVLSASVPARGGRPDETGVVNAQYKNYWVFCEVIDREMEFSGRMMFEEEMLTDRNAQWHMKWNDAQRRLSLPALREAANRLAGDLCRWETEYFESFATGNRNVDVELVLEFYSNLAQEIRSAPENALYFSIGHGSGWHKLTIGLLLEKRLSAERFAELRRNLKLADRHTEFEYPKSRKLVMSGETRADSPFGWVRLDFHPL